MNCADHGEDLVALALGQGGPAEASEIERHLESCAACRDELAATRRLIVVARGEAAPEPSADGERRLLAALRAERASPAAGVPEPPPASLHAGRRRLARIVAIALPLAAAAAVMIAVLSTEEDSMDANVLRGTGSYRGALRQDAASIELAPGDFTFGRDDAVHAGETELAVALTLRRGSAAPRAGQPAAGRVEVTLAPGARLLRRGPAELELAEGSAEIAAGPLASELTLRHGDLVAAVRGTRFLAVTAGSRMAVVVHEGTVEFGRRGAASGNLLLAAGHQGFADAERLLERPVEGPPAGARPGDAFLTPRIQVALKPAGPASRPPLLDVLMTVGDGGPVSIAAFDDAEARFLLRLTGPDGREREIKLQRSMLALPAPPAAGRTFRLTPETPYRLVFTLEGIGLPPGRHVCRVRSISYRPRGGGDDWLGVAESEPVEFEVGR